MAARLESYLAQRNQLILDDTSLRQDRIKLASLTPAEAEAETIVRRIRREESETVREPHLRIDIMFDSNFQGLEPSK